MKYLLYLMLLSTLLTSCGKQDDPIKDCNVDNPIEDLEWLQELRESLTCTCHSSIAQGIYKGQTVFYLIIPSFYCDAAGVTLWDCDGEIVKVFRYIDKDPDMINIEEVRILYTCE